MSLTPPDPASPESASEQLRAQVASRAAGGDLPAGTRLPTVRALAAELGVAPGTVAKAYRQLETDGVVTTHGRRGTFVAGGAATPAQTADAAASYATAARRAGLTLPQALRLLEDAW